MRASLATALVLPVALTGCPALLSDWTISGDSAADAGVDAQGNGGGGSSGGSGASSGGNSTGGADASVASVGGSSGGAPGPTAGSTGADGSVDGFTNGTGGSVGSGGVFGAGGETISSGGGTGVGGTTNTGGVTSTGGTSGAGDAPSCLGLSADCGPAGNESCCATLPVTGGTFYRSYDGVNPGYTSQAYPATVSNFRLDKYEITVGRFRKFVAAYSQSMIASGAGKNPNNASDPGWDTAWNASLPATAAMLQTAIACDATYQTWTGGNDNRPMNCIDWYEANAFCIWDGGRLPTEAEWNYAAAGGTDQRVYPWGPTAPGANAALAVHGCYYNDTGSCTGVANIAPVGSVSAGNGTYGQADLAGNVFEWTLDSYGGYAQSCTNCVDTTATTDRVLRGGSFGSDALSLLSSYRDHWGPSNRYDDIGSRCARTP